MKLIITKKQLKLIIESEQKGRLFTIPEDFLSMDNGVTKALNLYYKNKENRGWDGISIMGNLNLYDMKADSVEDIINFVKEIVYIDGSLKVRKLDSVLFPNLEYVDGNLYIINNKIKSLPNLESVGGYLYIGSSQFDSLPMLSKVGKGLFLINTPIKELPMLSYVGGYLNLDRTPIESLPMLSYVGGYLNLDRTPLSKTTTKEELRNKIEIRGEIVL